jgi:hypothetical protein
MTGLEAAAPVPIATATVADIASPAMRPMGRRIDAVLDRDTVPTVIESASRGALTTRRRHTLRSPACLSTPTSRYRRVHLLAGLLAAGGWRLAAGGSMSAKELSDAWARQISWC